MKILLNHQGQASVFVLALMGVVLVATIFLYQSGRVTSEKMQLQNAADAAAFGASTLEARSLNFSAYTNRAMVANEVAIGQMVGILSMVDEVKSLGEYLQAYGAAIELATGWLFLVVTVGDVIEGIISGLVAILEEVGEGIEAVGEAIAKVLDVIATPVVTGLSINNEVYSVSQQLYHGATMVLVTTNMFKSLEDNTYGTHFSLTDLVKRNRSGAQVSDLGLISLAMHMPSYWSGYTERYSTSTTSTKKDKDKKKKEKDATDKQKKEDKEKEDQTKKDDLKKEEQQKNDDLNEEEQQKKDDLKQEEHLEQDDKAAEDKLEGKDKEAKEKEDRDKEASKKLDDKTTENKKKVEDQQKENKQKLEDQKKQNKEKLDDQKNEAGTTKKIKKSKKQTKNDAGMGRMAATVRNARDPFSSGGDPIRVKNFVGMEVDYKNRDWFLGLELILNPKGKFDLALIKADYELNLGLSVGIRSKGGSEIRYKDETYIWSGLDTLLGGPGFKWGYNINITEGIGKFSTHQHYKGKHEVELGLPLGGGVSQAIKSAAEDVEGGALTPVDFIDSPGLFTLEPYAYGEAGKGERMIMVEAASPDLEDNQVAGYSGLKAYRDRPDDKAKEDPKKPPVIPFQSPFFIVGLTRQMDDITDKGPQFSGKLDLIHDDDNKLINHIGVIAKSQVYFSRPQDLYYFLRDDKQKEKSNVFSPFWQARLVDTTNLDRLLALAMQDHVVWLSGNIQDDVPGLKKVIQFLQDVFGVFR